MVEVRQINPNAFKELDLKLKQLEGYESRVGWGEEAKYGDGTPVAYVATIQEFGWGKIPPRPFMRPAAKKHEQDWRNTAAIAAQGILDGKITGQQGMDLIGQRAQDDVLQAIIDVVSPALSPITMVLRLWRRQGRKITGKVVGEAAARLAKGEIIDTAGVSDKPLNDTGYMISTLTHRTSSTS